MDRPNILFILSDQQRWDTCGCYGQSLDITPNLDRMATEGVRFANAFTCQPVCGPARTCLQTGKYATEVGCHTNQRRLPRSEETLAHHLSGGGYEVSYIEKWHLASRGLKDGPNNFADHPVPEELRGGYRDFWLAADILEFTSHGYDGHMFDGAGLKREFPPGRYRVDAQTDWVLEYLRQRISGAPFFLFVSYIEPHHQNDHGHYKGPHGSKEKFRDFHIQGDLEGTDGDWREEYADYLGCIHSLDQNVGRIREALDELNISENTLVFYTSDHGSHFRTRNSEYKRSCHDACIRLPMILHGPGFSDGAVVDNLVSLIDLPPTVLTAGGVRPPTTMRGHPLHKLVNGDMKGRPREVFLQISESHCGRAIRTRKGKYSVRASDPARTRKDATSDVYEEDFLYDLESDPHERNNLVHRGDLSGIRAKLAHTLKKRMVAAGEKVPVIQPRKIGDV